MSSINDESLLQEFVAESREHLSSIEPDLLILEREKKDTDPEIINRIFRAIHSIKGASGFFGLESLKSLSHSMENTLMLLRDGKLSPSSEVMDPLLIGVDRLRLMLEDIQASESVEYQDVVAALENLINPEGGTKSPTKNEKAEATSTETVAMSSDSFKPDRATVEQAESHGKALYKLQIILDTDLYAKRQTPSSFQELLNSTGIILDSKPALSAFTDEKGGPEGVAIWEILYASVLEPDLISETFELPQSQIQTVSFNELFPTRESDAANTTVNATDTDAGNPEEVSAPEDTQTSPPKAVAEPLQKSPQAATPKTTSNNNTESNETIRVKVDLLNQLMDLAGELVLARNQLSRIFETQANKSSDMSNIIQNVNLVTSDLQEHIMQTRMQAISSVFGKFPRLVRDLSRQLKKEITLEMSGEEVELDKSILESLSDPLTHLIRNCCDHAIEMPEKRKANGKSAQGKIFLKAYQESGHINIAVIDDGAGIDHERVAQKALDAGIISEAAVRQMTAQEQVNLIFMPGFSTAEAVTDVSGRGVGMDVVRTNIEQIGGSISIETEKGQGTTILLRLPLTLAIIPSLVVRAGEQTFAVPQINLVELVSVKASQVSSKIEKVGTANVLRLRGKLLPLIKLSEVLNLDALNATHESSSNHDDKSDDDSTAKPASKHAKEETTDGNQDYNILVLKSGNKPYGLIVDEIKDIEEIVVKPLSHFIKSCKCFSGATIMGDGRIAMILDVAGIITTANLSFSEMSAEEEKGKLTSSTQIISNQTQSILLFTNALNEIFAMPLSSILRLEKIKMSSIEKVGNQKFLPYQGKSMSLIFLHENLPVSPLPSELEEAYLIIPAEETCTVGIVASSILDAMEFTIQLEPSLINNPGISGSAVINNHVTLFINPHGLLEKSGFNPQAKRNLDAWQADRLQPSC